MRYNLFYVLYPLGAGSEAAIMYATVPYVAAKFGDVAKWSVLALSTIIWPLALSVMMLRA